ncbi:MAG: endonuclease V [Benjaminiella poitrasii]|nr:MAG: endonuclease V [Benjaminiella poitrasii]
MTFPDLKIVYKEFLHVKLHLPYIAGYLAFREVEPLMRLLNQLKEAAPELYPQAILVDGNGLLHPRKFGIASHLGVLSDMPTIGVSKNFLVIPEELDDMAMTKASYRQVLLRKGDQYRLVGQSSQSVYGAAVRTSDNAPNPVFVSQGHRITLETAIRVVLAVCPRYRIPEPIRAADLESRAYIREHGVSSA